MWGLRSARSVPVIAARRGIEELNLGYHCRRYRRSEVESLRPETAAAPPAPQPVAVVAVTGADLLRGGPRAGARGPRRRRVADAS